MEKAWALQRSHVWGDTSLFGFPGCAVCTISETKWHASWHATRKRTTRTAQVAMLATLIIQLLFFSWQTVWSHENLIHMLFPQPYNRMSVKPWELLRSVSQVRRHHTALASCTSCIIFSPDSVGFSGCLPRTFCYFLILNLALDRMSFLYLLSG